MRKSTQAAARIPQQRLAFYERRPVLPWASAIRFTIYQNHNQQNERYEICKNACNHAKPRQIPPSEIISTNDESEDLLS